MENEKELCKVVHKYELNTNESYRTCVLSPYEEYYYKDCLYFKVLRILSTRWTIKASVIKKFGISVYFNNDTLYKYLITFKANGFKRNMMCECPPNPRRILELMKDINEFSYAVQKFIVNIDRITDVMYCIRKNIKMRDRTYGKRKRVV